MPELPEVETTKASLKPLLNQVVNKVSVFQSKLRWPVPDNLNSLQGYRLAEVRRRAKYLILTFNKSSAANTNDLNKNSTLSDDNSSSKSLIIHLGMSGSLQQFPADTEKRKHDHLIIQFSDLGPRSVDLDSLTQLHYHDPRRFGAILWFDDFSDKLLNHLGPEPLEENFTGLYLYNRIQKISNKKQGSQVKPITRPIKAVIMDQVFVVGVGNIYATESLFLSGIHPSTPAHYLSLSQLEILVEHIKAILKRAIQQGGSTLRDFTVASGTTGYFQQTLLVYGKHNDDCPHCRTTIEKVSITGRASTFCPNCQPLLTQPLTDT